MNDNNQFTLLIPTFNRPNDLFRLLTYLERHGSNFPILVLDSSSEDVHAKNQEQAARLKLNISFGLYDTSTGPWEKYWRGSELVETEFTCFCADDDLIIFEAISPLLEFLQNHPDYSVAHGWYFTFYQNVHFGITSIVYSGSSLESDDPLQRVRNLFEKYEAVTYGMYRTNIIKQVLESAQGLSSLLGRELLAGGLTAATGKVARLPIIYYGRSLGPSQPYTNWHPLEYLVSSPEALFSEYANYRRILLDALKLQCPSRHTDPDWYKFIDLIHLKYFSEYLKPEIATYLLDQVLLGRDKLTIMQGIWTILADGESAAINKLRRSGFLKKIRDSLAPNFRLHYVARYLSPREHKIVYTKTTSGQQREYWLYKNFMISIANLNGFPVNDKFWIFGCKFLCGCSWIVILPFGVASRDFP